jgi:hypothetical protein
VSEAIISPTVHTVARMEKKPTLQKRVQEGMSWDDEREDSMSLD